MADEWKRELGIPSDSPVVLFAGKFEPDKRPLDLLQAFTRTAESLRKARKQEPVLLFVGSGPLESELKAQAGNRIGRTIFFAPFQNQSRMPVVYAACSVFVLPSHGETWGLSVNEAMNLARPAIVSTHVGCAPDLIREGETGWTFEAGSVDALASVLAEALRDPERTAEMGRAARDHISRYSFEAATEGLMTALDALVPNP